MEKVKQFINLPFRYHLIVAFVIRLALIAYGDYHDRHYDVSYTDVDYKVFTDAARHVSNGESPYKRHTYRYSPIIAFLLGPNVYIHRNYGKILFSVIDNLIATAIRCIVRHQFDKDQNVMLISKYCAFFWLYNPMSIAISTRGNADSLPCSLVILSLLYLQTDFIKGLRKYVYAGFLLGTAIHLRLYPLAFSFPMYLSLGEYKITRRTNFAQGFMSLMPNTKQVILAFSCVATLSSLTYGMYLLYNYEFLFETYIYHLFRKDTRHNFSVLFYYSYITMDQFNFDIVKTVSQILEFIILFVISLVFGCEPRSLSFALFCQAVVLVAFNSVMTSQYFIWFLSLLPLVVHSFKLKPASAVTLVVMWLSTQAAWLFYAYLLEFKSREVFIWIWLKSVLFFCANIYVLGQLIKNYTPGYGFGQMNLISKTK